MCNLRGNSINRSRISPCFPTSIIPLQLLYDYYKKRSAKESSSRSLQVEPVYVKPNEISLTLADRLKRVLTASNCPATAAQWRPVRFQDCCWLRSLNTIS